MKRYHFVYRAVTNKNPLPKEVQIDRLRAAHVVLRQFIRASGPGVWGAFLAHLRSKMCSLSFRWNLDEVGLEIFPDRARTIVKKGSVRVRSFHCLIVRLSLGGTGKSRRFCTLMVLVSATGNQPEKITVIFAARTGERLSDEAKLYDRDVNVL